MATQVVCYETSDGTRVMVEVDPVEGFVPAGVGDVAGRVSEALGPALAAASEVLGRVRSLGPDGVQVKFAIKATGTVDWIVAKAATEGNFEVTLSWNSSRVRPAGETTGPTTSPA